uniref:C-SKI_SMAD_bind domain-containing protein n=1 Tax=Anopheles funestus TaxID=62324 RepID=A0A4Y0BIX0_ANOFN
MTEYVPPHVISVLKTYQDKAPRSLHGPGLSLVHPSKASSAIVVGRADTPDLHGGAGTQQHLPLHHQHTHGTEHGASRAGSDEDVQQQQQTRQQPMGPPVPGVPIMTTPDPDCGIVQMTMLEGKRIGCFLLGGETRLCLPQIFNNILMDFSVEQINRSIQELMIYLYNCTDQQLQEFKRANIIPDTAKTCGLITRTNAERLCSSLLHQAHELRPRLKGGGGVLNGSFRVYHRCFGKGEGLFLPELYSFEEPTCIECAECRGLFSPQKFVCHQHEPQEIRTCHWGFNSSNWRSYIHVVESEKNRDEYAQVLEKIWLKEREIEQELECERVFWIARRKAAFEDVGPIAIKAEPLDIPIKKPKLMSDVASLYHCSSNSSSSSSSSGNSRHQHYAAQQQLLVQQQQHHLHHHQQQQQTNAAFRPWTAQQKAQKYAQQQQQALLLQQITPYANGTTTTIVNGTIRATSPGGTILTLSQEPPLLQNPENVVPMSETDKFERSYQPNVALVPRKTILCGKDAGTVSVAPGQQRREYEGKDRSVIKCEVVQIKQESPSTPPATSHGTGGSSAVDGPMRSVIKCDVQIKQERPGTPLSTASGHMEHGGRSERGDNSRSPGPTNSAHIPGSPPPPPGTSHQHQLSQGAIAISTIIAKQHHQQVSSMATYGDSNSNSPVPIQLDVPHSGSSGSNEITSSTSPLPPTSIVINMNGGEGVAGVEGRDKPKLVLIKEPISPPLSTLTPASRRTPPGHMLQQQQGGVSGHHSQQVSSPPPPHHQPLYLHHHQVLQQQQHHHFRSHHPGTAPAGTIIHRNGLPIVGNSEFELSTDTDDDSQAGEPDSSNVPSTMELIGEVLKEVEPETKQQIQDIFKVLLQETRIEHHRLQMEIRAKEDQLMEMQRHKMELQRQTDHFQQQIHQLQHELDRALLKIDSLREHQHQLSQQQQHQQHHILIRETLGGIGESSTSSTPPSPLSLVSNGSNSNHSHQLIERRNSFPEKSEIIMKPLKKLLRRSPDDATTVLMLASPPPQTTGSLPTAIPACLSITATTVSVSAPKASSIQPVAEPARDDIRRQQQQHSSSSTSPSPTGQQGGVLRTSSPAVPHQPPPPPTSATNVPVSTTTITAVSSVNGSVSAMAGPSTAPSISKTTTPAENSPSSSPIVVVIPVSSSAPLPKDATAGSPRPVSRGGTPTSPRCDRDAKGCPTPHDAQDEVVEDEDEPMEDAPIGVAISSPAAESKAESAPDGTGSTVKVASSNGKATIGPTTITSNSASSGASNQENDSPNRSKGNNSGGVRSNCDN